MAGPDPARGNPSEDPRGSPWMRPEEAAGYLGIALGTLRNWTSARYVPFARRGRVVRYHRDVLDRWLARGSCPGRMTIADDRMT
jgi:excisionase family DNA binding protein